MTKKTTVDNKINNDEHEIIGKLNLEREARKYAEDIIATIREPLVVLDVNLKVILVNKAFCQTFKVNPEETVGEFVYDLGNRQWNIPKLRRLLEDILPNNSNFNNFVVEHKFESIGIKTMLLNARRIPRPPAKPKIILLAIEDITKRTKKDRHTLEASEIRYRRLFESARDGILLIDSHTGMILDVNEFLINLLGYSKESFLKKYLWDIGIFKDIAASKENFLTLQTKKYIRFENLPLLTKNGKKIAVEFVANTYAVDGETIIQCNIRDITERRQIQDALIESRQQLADLIEFLPDATMAIDSNGKIIAWNHAIEQMTNTKAKDMLGKGNYEHAIPFYGTRRPVLMDLIYKTSDEMRKKYHYIHKEGDVLTTEADAPIGGKENHVLWAKASPLYDINHKIVGAIESVRDVTERKRMEHELSQTNQKNFKNIFNHAADGILLADAKSMKFHMANPAICHMLGYTQKEINNLGVTDIHPKNNLSYVLEQFEKQAKGEIKLSRDLPVKKKNGTIIYVDVNASVITISGKTYLMGFFHDNTERRHADEALIKSEKRFRVLFESSQDAIMTLNPPSWKFTSCNLATVRLFGVKNEAEFTSYGPWNVAPKLQPDGKPSSKKAKKMIQIAMDKGSNYFEWIHKRIGGNIFFTTVLLTRVEIEKGKPFLLATVRDITEQKKMEQKIITEKAIIESNKAKEDFLNIAAHDLRTPISGIRANTEMILEGDYGEVPSKLKTPLLDIDKANLSLIKMVDDFLTIGRIEKGKIIIIPTPTNILPILNSVVKQTKLLAEKAGLKFNYKVPEKLPLILADPDKISEVITNLLDNAIKFTSKGSISLSASVKNNSVEVKIMDTGTGIAKERQQDLFKKYAQVGADKRIAYSKGYGLGLGLYISRLIINGCKGKIWMESEFGKGSTFYFSLPLVKKH